MWDWTKVVALNPRGYLELYDDVKVTYGPIASIAINYMGCVEIRLKWRRQRLRHANGSPNGEWKEVNNDDPISFSGSNVPFMIHNDVSQVRYGRRNVIHLDEIADDSPSTIAGRIA
jgi:hypothetical protein